MDSRRVFNGRPAKKGEASHGITRICVEGQHSGLNISCSVVAEARSAQAQMGKAILIFRFCMSPSRCQSVLPAGCAPGAALQQPGRCSD